MQETPFPPDALGRDAFLGGRVQLWQPRRGYRAGIDPVLLAASVPARAGQSVLDLGCGAAPALCCLGARVAGLDLAGLEIQPGYAALARTNLAENGHGAAIWDGDVADPPRALRARRFDHVMLNPPYFDSAHRAPATDPGREIALAGGTPLTDWIGCAARRLAPRGQAHVILRVERLPELMAAMHAHLGALELLPLLPRADRSPHLILMRGRKGGRAAFRLHAGLVLHDGAQHGDDDDGYTAAIRAVLRDAAPLPFPA